MYLFKTYLNEIENINANDNLAYSGEEQAHLTPEISDGGGVCFAPLWPLPFFPH